MTPVLFDHDGGVDDLISLLLIGLSPDIELKAVTVTPADCLLSDAVESTLKLLTLTGRSVPVAAGRYYGVNPFPHEWRVQPKIINALPDMLRIKEDRRTLSSLPADELMIQTLDAAEEPLTVLMTGPCTNLVKALSHREDLKTKIARVVWMGGAVDVAGNVVIHNHDGTAEWNAYWDPPATQALIEMQLPLTLVALDACNSVPVDIAFLRRLAEVGRDSSSKADLAGQFWATTINSLPSYEYVYHLWDVLATSYVVLGERAIECDRMPLSVSAAEPNAGQTFRDEAKGVPVNVAKRVDREKVFSWIFECLG
ncbi:MAG: nucleoside hydrolase, partial [Myxococcota bacterium]